MRQFPLAAQVYIWSVIGVGAVALILGYCLGVPRESWQYLVGGCAFSVLAGLGKVQVPLLRVRARDNSVRQGNSTISLGFVPTFFLLLYLGPFAGMVAGLLNAVVTTCYPKRSFYYQVLFSVADVCISVLLAGLVLRPFGLAPAIPMGPDAVVFTDSPQAILRICGVALATVVYYLVNTGLVAAVVSLVSGRKPVAVWKQDFLWIGPSYFVGASCAVMALALMPYVVGNPWRVAAMVCVAVPIPGFMFLVYRYHRVNAMIREEYIEQLQASKADLERANGELAQSKSDLQKLFESTVESLALAIDAKDRYTKEHIQRVREIAVGIAEEMGLEGDDLNAIGIGALLHDIGKLAVPEHILTKPGRLTEEEFEKVKAHPENGAAILRPVPFPFPVLPIVRSHHERWDGTGYPDGLRGENIPLGARILAVADVYDALTTDRSYRQGWTEEEALQFLRDNAGTHFDPAVVKAFLAMLEESPRLHTFATSRLSQENAVANDAVAEINRASFEYISLYEISQTVSATLNLSETLSLLAAKVKNIFNASTCVLLIRGDDEVLYAQRATGVNEGAFAGARTAFGDGLTGRVASGKQGYVGDFDPEDLIRRDDSRSSVPLRSALIAPLVADGQMIGTLNLYHERAGAFDGEDLRVLQAVAQQVGRAIRNAREYDRTRESAYTDSLTGLYNARHLAQFLDRELDKARGERRTLTVLVLDLDNFKPVNDRYGHSRGNEVLRDLGGIFQSVLRSGDLVARYAGDEFVIVLPNVGPTEACYVIDKIRAAVDLYDPRQSGGDLGDIQIGVSIGAASFPADGADALTLIASADRAMYRDKSERKARNLQAAPETDFEMAVG